MSKFCKNCGEELVDSAKFCKNCGIHLETMEDNPYVKNVNPFKVESDGCIRIPKGPGLGIEVDEEALEVLRFEGNWDTPRLLFEDGSVADW